MKNLKLKFTFFSLLAAMTLTVFMTSCEQEQISPRAVNQTEIPVEVLKKWESIKPEMMEYVENLTPEMLANLESPPEAALEYMTNTDIADRSDCFEYYTPTYFPQIGWATVFPFPFDDPYVVVFSIKYTEVFLASPFDLCTPGLSFRLLNFGSCPENEPYLSDDLSEVPECQIRHICGATGWFWDDDETDNSVRNFTSNGIQDVYCEGGGSDIEWTDKTGVNEGEDVNTLSRSLHSGWDCNSGAASVNTIPAGEDGWVEMTVAENWSTKFFGLSNSNSDACRWTIDYSVYFNGHQLRIYESGQNKIYAANCAVGDAVRVERVGSTIYYKKNGATIYTSHKPSYGALVADVSIKDRNGIIGHSRCSH